MIDDSRPVLAVLATTFILALTAMPVGAQTCVFPELCVDDLPESAATPQVSVTAADAEGVEAGGDQITFTIRKTAGALPNDITVTFSFSGTATNGVDYTAAPTQSVIFTATDSIKTVSVTPEPDLFLEGDETVTLTLNPPSPTPTYTVVGSPATAILKDSPPVQVFVTGPVQIIEGDLGVVVVQRTTSSPTNVPAIVNLQFGGAATRGTDYTLTGVDGDNTVTIPALQASATFGVQSVQDAITGTETFIVTLGTSSTYLAVAPTSATINLVDDAAPQFTLATSDDSATEAGATGAFTVTRTGPQSADMPVSFEVLSGTGSATRVSDYVIKSGATTLSADSFTFPAATTSAVLTVQPLQDTAREGSETVRVRLVPSGTAYTLGLATQGTVTILDDDIPTVTATATDTQAAEAGANPGAIHFARSATSDTTMSVAFTVGGTATSATSGSVTDFALSFTATQGVTLAYTAGGTTGTLTFAPTSTATGATVLVTPIDDSTGEAAETVILAVAASNASPPTYGAGTPSSATVTIADNDVILDGDGDGKPDASDNCPTVANADQANADGATDGGDACDTDDDNDGLTDAQEDALGTKRGVSDTDVDGRSDKQEVTDGTNPLSDLSPEYRPTAASILVTVTGDGVKVAWTAPGNTLVNRFLVFRASDPVLVGTKAATASASPSELDFVDATYPGGNHTYYVQPMLAAQAGTAFNATRAVASTEINFALCEAFTSDADGDGLCDHDEIARGTNVNDADTDRDGETDQDEVAAGTDPLDSQQSGASRVNLARETPFWLGLVLLVSTVGIVVAGFVVARRRA